MMSGKFCGNSEENPMPILGASISSEPKKTSTEIAF